MRFILLHHRLGGYSSHHFNESVGFREELGRRGQELLLLVSQQADPRVVRELGARAVLDADPTFRLEWTFEERSRRFAGMLRRHVGRIVRPNDCVMVTIATQVEAHALALWLAERPAGRKPWVVVLFLSDRWNREETEERERQLAEYAQVGRTLSNLDRDDAQRLIFAAVTPLLAGALSEMLATPVMTVPMPVAYRPLERATPQRNGAPAISILGGTRREKGSHRIPQIIAACRSRMAVEFFVQLTNNGLTAEERSDVASIARQPGVTVIEEAMPPSDYQAAVDRSDIALFPYELIPYRMRTSGVFAEAVAAGKPVVVTPGTWLAEQVSSGLAAGVVSADHSPQAIADAVVECLGQLEPLRRRALEGVESWRRTVSLTRFMDHLEGELRERGAFSSPPRRTFWQRLTGN